MPQPVPPFFLSPTHSTNFSYQITSNAQVLRFFVSTLLYGPFVFATIVCIQLQPQFSCNLTHQVLPLVVSQRANMLPLAPSHNKSWLLSLIDEGLLHTAPALSLTHTLLDAAALLAAAWLFSSLWRWNNQPFIRLIRSWCQVRPGTENYITTNVYNSRLVTQPCVLT